MITIGEIVASTLSVINTIMKNGHSDNIAMYESKKNTVLMMKKKLDSPFRNGTVFEKTLNICGSSVPVTEIEEERLEIDVEKLFSKNIVFRYEEIKEMVKEWKIIDFELDELLDNVRYGEPERFDMIVKAMEGELNDDGLLSPELDRLTITLHRRKQDNDWVRYDYRELEMQFDEKAVQYEEAATAILKERIEEITEP